MAFLDPDWSITEEGGGSAELSELFDLRTNELGQDVLGNPADGTEKDGSSEDVEAHLLKELLIPLAGVMGFEVSDDEFRGTLFRLPLRMGQMMQIIIIIDIR